MVVVLVVAVLWVEVVVEACLYWCRYTVLFVTVP